MLKKPDFGGCFKSPPVADKFVLSCALHLALLKTQLAPFW